jgi:hypothetical protein
VAGNMRRALFSMVKHNINFFREDNVVVEDSLNNRGIEQPARRWGNFLNGTGERTQ